ncbi:MAG: D-2-hydroxyacid dehydrogenase [Salinivirgaceae bacterium]|nr:D-2-hydroxyacid dehydrogenase [Salinivirgaceae bacterium]
MKIVVLDGYCLNPGDLDWSGFEPMGSITVYDRTPAALTIERSKDAAALLTNKTVLTAENMSQMPNLKYVGVLATGYNVVDLQYAASRGIVVTNIPAYSTASVAQMVFAHILNIANSVEHHSQLVRGGAWSGSIDFCFWDRPQVELAGKTIGLVGLGNTGMATARIALAFGMKVIAVTSKKNLPEGIKSVSYSDLWQQSDIVSLHCPLSADTRNLVNTSTIAQMKPSAILINTGRGPLIDEQALADALNGGRIAAAAVDVLSTEPPTADNPLLTARNCFITPHIAWATREARQRLMDIAVGNLKAFAEGKPVNVVNG